MRTRIPAIVTLCLVLLPGDGPTFANSDPIVIELGEIFVTREQLNDRFQVALHMLARQQGISLAEQDSSVIERLRVQFLDKHATELVMLQEAARRDIAVSPQDVDETVAQVLGSPEAKEAFADEKLLRQIVHDEITIQSLTAQILQDIVIPPGDVVTLHHDIKHTLITPEEVCFRHIQSASAEAAKEVLVELENDADFAKLASKRSTDETSAGNGGDLGCFQKGHMESKSEFEKVAFAARKGSIVGPVKSESGYHVINVYAYKPLHELTLNEAYDEIERELKQEQLPNHVNALISESGIKTYPENFVASDAGG